MLICFEAAKILKINEKNVGVVKSEGEIEVYRTGKSWIKKVSRTDERCKFNEKKNIWTFCVEKWHLKSGEKRCLICLVVNAKRHITSGTLERFPISV